MAQYFRLPAASITATNPSVGTNGSAAPTSSTEIAGKSGAGNLVPVLVDSSGQPQVVVTSSTLPTGASTAALQTSGNASLTSIDGKTPALGQALAAASVPVVLPAAQVTALTPPTTVTVTQATGTNLHAVIDSGAVTVSGTVTANAGTGTMAVSAAALPLPTGASTAANQATEIASLATIATNSGTQATAANQTSGNASLTTIATNTVVGRAKANAPVLNAYASTAVTTSAYVQLVASTTAATNYVEIYNTCSSNIYLATGAAASEVNQIIIPAGGNGLIPLAIPASARVSVKAADVNATTGNLVVNFYA